MLDAGMNVARVDYSDGLYAHNVERLTNLKAAMKKCPHQTCKILLDLKGPSITTSRLSGNGYVLRPNKIDLKAGQTLEIVADPYFVAFKDNNTIGCSYEGLVKKVQTGSIIKLANGGLTCTVKSVDKKSIICECLNDYVLGEYEVIHIPGATSDLPSLTQKDLHGIALGLKGKVDIIATSVRKSDDVLAIRKELGEEGQGI